MSLRRRVLAFPPAPLARDLKKKKGLQSRGKRQVTVKEGKHEEEKRREGGTLLLLGIATNKDEEESEEFGVTICIRQRG